jgi:hypothetical protein
VKEVFCLISWIALLNLALIATVLGIYMHVQYRFDLQSLLISPAHDRILSTGWQTALELRDSDRALWDQLLQRYADEPVRVADAVDRS